MIEQLWYTWSGTGIRRSLVGFQVRAASPGLLYQPEEFYQFIQNHAFYRLPDNVDPDTPDGPVGLALLDSPRGKLLLRKVCAGRDPFQRPGNFFIHMLLGLPESFSARDAIRLWDAPFWKSHDVSEEEQSTHLPVLSLDELKLRKQHFRFVEVQEELRMLITAFLSPDRLEQHVLIEGSTQHITMLIWGLTHGLPITLFPPAFTFSTYEYDVNGFQGTIVGTTTADWLHSQFSRPPVVSYFPLLRGYDTDLEADIEAYATFAMKSLSQAEDGYAPELQAIVAQAEDKNITTVEAFMALFRAATQSVAFPPSPVQEKKVPLLAAMPAPSAESPYSPSSAIPQIPPAELLYPLPPVTAQIPDQSTLPVWKKVPDHFLDDLLQFGNRSFHRSKSRLYLVAFALILLLASYFLVYVAGTNNVNITAIRSTVVAQTLSSVSAQQTRVAQATARAVATHEAGNDNDMVLDYTLLQKGKVLPQSPTLQLGSQFTVSILFFNNGNSTWTAARGYVLVCIPNNDPDCRNTQFQGLMGNSVQPKQVYAFSVVLTAKMPITLHHITLSVAHNGMPIGTSQKILFSVK